MRTIQISIQATEAEQEILISQLADCKASGFEQQEGSLIAFFPADQFESYEIANLLQEHPHTIQTLEEQNWNALWEANFEPVVVEDFCAIRADFHAPIAGVTHEIIITPKMSFGTGHHATTHMMIAQMRHIHFEGKEVFDFGTGTGILAILAEMQGASRIDAIDVDDWSIENTMENAARNQCSHIHVSLGSQLPQHAYDIVLANINRNVLLEYMKGLQEVVKPGGVLLLSGLLKEDATVIIASAEENGFVFDNQIERNNWISILLHRSAC